MFRCILQRKLFFQTVLKSKLNLSLLLIVEKKVYATAAINIFALLILKLKLDIYGINQAYFLRIYINR